MLRNGAVLTVFLLGLELLIKKKNMINWIDVYEDVKDKLPENFVYDQLSYFAGWRQHLGGTVENTILAEKLLKDWRSWGWPIVKTVNFKARLPRGPQIEGPWNKVSILDRDTQVEIRKAQNFVTFNCTDNQPHSNETCSSNINFTAPVYCAFSAAGNATGRPVFVNYARADDLKFFNDASKLCSPDIIIVARHGKNSYGSKVRKIVSRCSELKSSSIPGGMIIYRDPIEDPSDIKVYPEGVGIPSDGITYRVSTMYKEGGDVETPGLPAIDGVYKIESADLKAVTPFPVQTISFDDAKVLINGMDGSPIPKDWQPSSFEFVGPEGDNLIKMDVRNEVSSKPSTLVDVIGIMPGNGPEADKYIILGNHRDAWVQGASDPHSGTVVLQGVAYLLGIAYSGGWRPKRSLVIASWDAEEVGLIGSTEFTELYREELLSKAVVYFNQDCPVKGNASFVVRTDQLLEQALLQSAAEVEGACNSSQSFFQEQALKRWKKPKKDPLTVPVEGSSDQVPFQYQLGIPSSYVEFRPEPPLTEAPSYHTAYDSVDMATKFTDPPCPNNGKILPLHNFLIRYHFHLMLKFSSSQRIPIFPVVKASTLQFAWKDILKYVKNTIPDIQTRYRIDLDYVSRSIGTFKNATIEFERFLASLDKSNPICPAYNDMLIRLSKQFITNVNTTIPRHILVDDSLSRTHAKSYFPRVRRLLQQLSECSEKEPEHLIKAIKTELSIIVTTFTAASNLLHGGLFESLDTVNTHLCPSFN
ncbi:hypothetical protein Aperf_G00000041331 [Anoplocephala perfoliata]